MFYEVLDHMGGVEMPVVTFAGGAEVCAGIFLPQPPRGCGDSVVVTCLAGSITTRRKLEKQLLLNLTSRLGTVS